MTMQTIDTRRWHAIYQHDTSEETKRDIDGVMHDLMVSLHEREYKTDSADKAEELVAAITRYLYLSNGWHIPTDEDALPGRDFLKAEG